MKISCNRILLAGLFAFILSSCAKEPGIGGDATIKGRVYEKHYNSTFTVLLAENYAPDVYVYLVFGDEINYGKRIKTNYNGEFEFEYLYEGPYKVYVYSIDSAATVDGVVLPPDSAVIQEVLIQDRKEFIELPDFVIYQ
jgi:hypothetical protein